MAVRAAEDTAKRIITVDKTKLLAKLKENRTQHVANYTEALEGYKVQAIEKLKAEADKARMKLEQRVQAKIVELNNFDPAEPDHSNDHVSLIDSVYIELKVPRNYAEAYDAAIAMFEWEVAEVTECSPAEFACWVTDKWDWSSGFENITKMYVGAVKRI